MRSRSALLPLLIALALVGSACDLGESPFVSPRSGSVTGTDVRVDLWIPPFARPELRLDGERVGAQGFDRQGLLYSGRLEGLETGPHRLTASYRLLFFFPVRVATSFEVGATADFDVRGSVRQVFVTRAEPGQALELRDRFDRSVAEASADEQGSRVFRDVRPGREYRVVGEGSPREVSEPLRVMSVEGSQPPREFYESQTVERGYGYITMRDGTKLSVYVTLPGPAEEGPYPTVVNYSGYSPSNPNGSALSLGGIDLSNLCDDLPILCDSPDHPAGLIAGALGYATVGVNMRGTGCSGGAYDFFETNQVLDGYDLIEIIAAQDWVKGGKVGMVGISYPGISQLYVAAAKPPSLAAITPLSIISGTDTTLAPGGILNNGFAIQWGSQVLEQADPYGQGWERERVEEEGDTICEESQLLHSQKVDIIQKAEDNPYYTPEVYDPLNPRTFVDEIEVPVFTTGAWQDEQTGGHFPDLWDRFESAEVVKRVGYNGAHADGFIPPVLVEWKNFLDFYVAGEFMPVPPLVESFSPILFQEIFGSPVALPEPPYDASMDFEEAKAEYEAEPPVRILFESGGGAGSAAPGAPLPGFELALEGWPPPGRVPERWYLHADGSLRRTEPDAAESASTFQHDGDKGAEAYEVEDSFEKALPDIRWKPWEPGRQVVFASDPLDEDLTMLGFASADLWVRSTASDADLEVMLSEIRPEGKEVYVTSGWLRASQRALAPESTPLRPVPTRLEEDAEPLPEGEWELVRVEIYPAGHVFRAGSRIRLSVSTPGGNKGRWKFDVLQLGEGTTHAVSHSTAHPSSVLLPVMPGLEAPTPLPTAGHGPHGCTGLRGQPCRDYEPHTNALLR